MLFGLIKRKERVPVFPSFSENDFGLGPFKETMPDGSTWFRCDVCKRYGPDVTVSPGDGFCECDNCRT